MLHLMNNAEDKSNGGEYSAKAKGILTKILEFQFVCCLHFTKDVLNEVAKASLLFQCEYICTASAASAVTKLQSVETNIRNLMENSGQHCLEFQQNFNKTCNAMNLKKIPLNISEMFKNLKMKK